MNSRQASVEVFDRIVQEERLTGKLLLVYSVLHRYGPMTARETADLLARTAKKPAGMPMAHGGLSALASLQCVRTVGRRACRITGEKALVWDVTDSLPVEPSAPPEPAKTEPTNQGEVERLRIENQNLKLRLSRWGRPPAVRKKDPASEPSLPLAGL